MKAKSALMLRLLADQFHRGNRESFLKPLSVEEVQLVIDQKAEEANAEHILNHPQSLVESIHYSWFESKLKLIPPSMREIIISSLPKSQSQPLCALLQITVPTATPHEKAKLFIINYLYKKLDKSHHLPRQLLPKNPLSELLELDKASLVEIIDLLGIYDLSEKIRNFVDKKKLSNIMNCLTPQQRKFLSVCLHRMEKIQQSDLDLSEWTNDCAKLHNMLHRKGLMRFGKAISGQSPDFVWHLIHRLDTGRGAILKKYYSENEIPIVTGVMVEQLQNTINFLKPKSEE
jgi:hypothetical protein